MAASRRKKILWGAALLLALLGSALAWVWLGGRGAAERMIQRRLQAGLSEIGCEMKSGELALELSPPLVRMTGLHVRCPGGELTVASVETAPRILPLLTGQIDLRRVDVESPELTWSGSPPSAPAGESAGESTPLPFRLSRLSLDGGRLRWSTPDGDRVDVQDVRVQSQGTLTLSGGAFTLDTGAIEAERLGRIVRAVSLSAEVTLQGNRLAASGLRLDLGDAGELSGDGSLTMGELPAYAADLIARVEPAAWTTLLPWPEGLEVGPLRWSGNVRGEGERWSIKGDLESSRLVYAGLEWTELRASGLEAGPTGLVVPEVDAGWLGGRLTGGVQLDHATASGWVLSPSLALSDVPLDGLVARAPWPAGWSRPQGRLGARLIGAVPLQSPRDLTGDWTVDLASPRGGEPATLRPAGRAAGRLASGELLITSADLGVEGLLLDLSGAVNLTGTGRAGFKLRAEDIGAITRQLAAHVPEVRGLAALQPAGSLRWAGEARFESTRWNAAGRVQGDGLTLTDRPLGEVKGEMELSERGIELRGIELNGPLGTVRVDGRHSSGVNPDTHFRLEIESLDLATAGQAAGVESLSGTLTGSIDIRQPEGSLEARFSAAGDAVGLEMGGLVLQGGPVRLEGSADVRGLDIGGLDVTLPGGGEIHASGSLPWSVPATGTAEGADDGTGARGVTFRLVDLPLAGLAEDLAGTADLSGTLGGSVASPRLSGDQTGRIRALAWKGWGGIDLDITGRGTPADLEVGLRETGGELEGELRFDLNARQAEGELALARRQWDVPARFVDGEPLRLESGAVTLRFRAGLDDLLAADLEARVESLRLAAGRTLAETGQPLEIKGSGGRVELSPLPLTVGGIAATLLGEADLPTAMWSARLDGAVGLAGLQPFLPGVRLSGIADVSARAAGEGFDVRVDGRVAVRDGYAKLEGFPHPVEQVTAEAVLEGESIRIVSLAGRFAGGRITGSGTLGIPGAEVAAYDLGLQGEAMTLRYPEHMRIVADADLRLSGNRGDAVVKGTVDIRSARYTEPWRVERSLIQGGPPPRTSFPPAPGPLDRVLLDVDVRAPSRIWLDNDFAKAEFRADLTARGSASRPVLDGTLELLRIGQLTFQKVKYDLTAASMAFTPLRPNDPELDALAKTRVSTYSVELGVSGHLSDLRFELSSQPELPAEEIVALLVSGGLWRRGEGIRSEGEILSSYLGEALGPVQQALQSFSGLDEARIDPVFVEGQGDPTARVTFSERISRRLSVSWSAVLGQAQGSTTEIRYRLLPNLEFRQAREETGANASEARYVRSFKTGPSAPSAESADEARPRPGELRVDGLPETVEVGSLRTAAGVHPELRLDDAELLLAASRMEGSLAERGYPLARCNCSLDDAAADAGRRDVICTVEPGPKVSLEITGLKKKEARRVENVVLGAWSNSAFADDLQDIAREAAEEWYRDRGHARVEVEVQRQGEAGERIKLEITPGPPVRAGEIRVNSEVLDQDDLDDQLDVGRRRLLRRPMVTPDLLAQDRERLRALHVARGYLGAQVEPAHLDYPDQPDEARITFDVTAGRRSPLRGVVLQGNQVLSTGALLGDHAAPRAPFPDPEVLESLAGSLRNSYDQAGHPDAVILWRLEAAEDGDAVRAVYEIQEGPAVRIGAVIIQGNLLTTETTIRREIKLENGAPFRRQDLFVMRRKIRDLDLFSSVVVKGQPTEREDVRDVLVIVDERNNLDLAVGAGFDDEEGARGSLSVGNRNLLGKGALASVQFRYGGEVRSGEMRTGWKRLRGSRNDFLASLAYKEEERDGFTERRTSLSTQISRPWDSKTDLQFRYRIEDVSLRDTTVPAAEIAISEGLLGSLGGSIVRNTLDDRFLPERGGLRSVNLNVYDEALLSESEFVKLFAQQSRFWRLGGKKVPGREGGPVFHGTLRVGMAWPYGVSSRVPISERFFAGGITSVRGYQQDFLGPLDPATGNPTGGASMFILNQELRVPLNRLINLHVFVDAGNVFPRAHDLDPFDLEASAGPGISINTPAGPFRLYLGYKLDPDRGEDRSRLQFTFGPTF